MISRPLSRKQPKASDIFFFRLTFLTVVLLLAFAAIVLRLAKLQVVDGAENRRIAEDQHSVYRRLLPSRGDIKIRDKFSFDTYPVATNIQKYLAYVVPQEVKNATATAETLEPVLGMAAGDILPRLTDTSRKYVSIKKLLSDQEVQRIKDLKLAGIYLDSEDIRVYPQGAMLSQVLGFVGYQGDERMGLYGLEKYFDDQLKGAEGSLKQEKDTAGAWIFGGKRQYAPAIDGENLILTIDKTIQYQAQKVLKESVEKHGADSGTVIVANPKTGAILAMAGYPDFDPNTYGKVTDHGVFQNEAVVGNYEPGSTFKAITMAAALNEGKVRPDSTYVDTGKVEIDGYTIENSDHKAHGVQTMTQVLDESLNTGAIYAKEQIGNETFYAYLKKFGFGDKTGIELPETKGNLENLRLKIQVNFDTATFGQGISVTPIQMVQAYTAFANGGVMMKPFIVESKVSAGGGVQETKQEAVRKVLEPRTANEIAAMLVDVVENGHGKKAGVPGYYIAGKTGTAQVVRKDGKPGYDPDNNIGSFIGFGPVEDPRFVMLVRVNHPRDVKFAESTAAPAFGALAKFILDYYGIPPTREIKK